MLLYSLITMPQLLPHVYKFKYLFYPKNHEVGDLLSFLPMIKAYSSHGLDLTFSPPLSFSCGSNPSNANHTKDVFMPLNGSSFNLENNLLIPS